MSLTPPSGALDPRAPASATPPPASATPPPTSAGHAPPGSLAELRARRLQLAQRVAELTFDLGGLAYEMAARDHYRLDVLARRAAELQRSDAELSELQRLLGAAQDGVHGQCRSCGAVHSRGAAYCWHCGAPLLREARPAAVEQTWPVIET